MYDREDILKQLVAAIEEYECTTFGDATLHVAPAPSTLYLWELEKSEDVKRALERNRIKFKAGMRKNWKRFDAAPVLQLAAYKLMADDDELERLTVAKNKNENTGEITVTWNEQKTYEGE